ncbi:MAG: COX15/CtaA family protein, partial [Candidatus Nucleicultricaceae bacterium]
MVILGGLTRLTGSGLSIVEWDLFKGIFPPLNEIDWVALFEAYKLSPEFQHVNFDFTLTDFKRIFWLEYCHRLLGRVIGLLYVTPILLGFMIKNGQKKLIWSLFGLFLLVSLQGIMGWLMVKSGLVYEPHVSHYRLSIHLLLAFLLYGATLLTYASAFLSPKPEIAAYRFRKSIIMLLGLTLMTIIYGAFVAGLKAGLIYNTFPLMGGSLLPENFLHLTPTYLNFFDNHGTVQFIHRLLALSTLVGILMTAYRAKKILQSTSALLKSFKCLVALGCIQVTLGILTLLYAVPLWLGVL